MRFHRFLILFVASAFALLALSGCAGGRMTSGQIDSFAQWVQADHSRAPLTVIIASDTDTRILDTAPESSRGWQGQFPVGSVTKVLTAILVLQGVEQGLYQLDDPVHFHPSGVEITWRQLLEHRAGFLDKRMDPTQPEATIPIVPPGLIHAYSNEGYAALGHALESHHGLAFADLARLRILTPLGIDGMTLETVTPNVGWSPPLGSSGLQGTSEQLSALAAAIARQDEKLLTKRGWSTLLELESWDRWPVQRGKAKPRYGLVQEGRVTGARSSLALFPRSRGAMMILFAEGDLDSDHLAEQHAQRVLEEATRRWGQRVKNTRSSFLNPLRLIRPEPCTICDWTIRYGVYFEPFSGEQLIIAEDGGAPTLIQEDGEILAIGPELIDGRSRLHELYTPIDNLDEGIVFPFIGNRANRENTIEFALQNGHVVGLIWGARWFEKLDL